MEDRQIKTEILNKIKKGDFRPKARWHFLLIDWLRWGAFALSVILGGLVLAAAISSLAQNDWHLYREVMGLQLGDIFSGVPLFWLVGLLLFAWLAEKQIYLTRSGYRLRLWQAVGLSLSAKSAKVSGALPAARLVPDRVARKSPTSSKAKKTETQWRREKVGD